MKTKRRKLRFLSLIVFIALGVSDQPARSADSVSIGQLYHPADVDWNKPVFHTTFDDVASLRNWSLEGGKRIAVEDGWMILENGRRDDTEPTRDGDHLVAWLKREVPANFLLEFTFLPRKASQGLAYGRCRIRGSLDTAGWQFTHCWLKTRRVHL